MVVNIHLYIKRDIYKHLKIPVLVNARRSSATSTYARTCRNSHRYSNLTFICIRKYKNEKERKIKKENYQSYSEDLIR